MKRAFKFLDPYSYLENNSVRDILQSDTLRAQCLIELRNYKEFPYPTAIESKRNSVISLRGEL